MPMCMGEWHPPWTCLLSQYLIVPHLKEEMMMSFLEFLCQRSVKLVTCYWPTSKPTGYLVAHLIAPAGYCTCAFNYMVLIYLPRPRDSTHSLTTDSQVRTRVVKTVGSFSPTLREVTLGFGCFGWLELIPILSGCYPHVVTFELYWNCPS